MDGGIPAIPGAGGGRGGQGGDTGDAGGFGWTDPQTIPPAPRSRRDVGGDDDSALKQFMEDGGMIPRSGVTSLYHAGLPIKNALVERVAGFAERPPAEKFFIPGRCSKRVDTNNRRHGMMRRHDLSSIAPAFRLQPEAQLKGARCVIDSPNSLRSGWAWGSSIRSGGRSTSADRQGQ